MSPTTSSPFLSSLTRSEIVSEIIFSTIFTISRSVMGAY